MRGNRGPLADQQTLMGVEQDLATSDDRYTPHWIFEGLGLTFDIDVAAPPGGVPWIPAKRYFTQRDDGLAQPWKGLVWCNPPFSGVGPWVNKFIRHANGLLLVPIAKASWFAPALNSADLVWFDNGNRSFFVKADGTLTCILFSVAILAIGEQAASGLYNLRDAGALLSPVD